MHYPDEFLRSIGDDSYELAPAMHLPTDGNLAHGGAHHDTELVPQHVWAPAWATYDQARRRLNWSSLTERGDGTGKMLTNLALVAVLVSSLLSVWSAWDSSSELAKLNGNLTVLSGQVARYANGQPATTSGVPNPSEGSLVPPPAPPFQPTQVPPRVPTPTVKGR